MPGPRMIAGNVRGYESFRSALLPVGLSIFLIVKSK